MRVTANMPPINPIQEIPTVKLWHITGQTGQYIGNSCYNQALITEKSKTQT